MTQNRCGRITFLLLVVISLAGSHNTLMATEEAEYSVLERDGDFELRQYQPQIVAETLVEGNFNAVGTKASDVCSTISQVKTVRSNPSP